MAPILHISLFDYQPFLTEVARFVPEIDAGNYATLLSLVRNSAARYSGMNEAEKNQSSPICVHGGVLPSPSRIDEPAPNARRLGEWILAALDQFLQTPNSFRHFASVNPILTTLGWSAESIERLLKGRPTFQLVKPDLSGAQPEIVEHSDPYWFWVRFDGADAGWLNSHDVQVLLEALDRDRERILAFDVEQLRMNGINLDDPIVREDFSRGVRGQLDFLRERLVLATKQHRGIFQSLIYIQ